MPARRLCEARMQAGPRANFASGKRRSAMWNEELVQCSKVFHYEKCLAVLWNKLFKMLIYKEKALSLI
jgi:hypothetical protein